MPLRHPDRMALRFPRKSAGARHHPKIPPSNYPMLSPSSASTIVQLRTAVPTFTQSPTHHPSPLHPTTHPTLLPESTTYRLIKFANCSPSPTGKSPQSALQPDRAEGTTHHMVEFSATSTREPYVETATLEMASMCCCCMRSERERLYPSGLHAE